jgi:hypothetical protein
MMTRNCAGEPPLLPKSETRSAAVCIRLRPSLKAAIDRLAAKDRRSTASFVQVVLEDRVTAAGE